MSERAKLFGNKEKLIRAFISKIKVPKRNSKKQIMIAPVGVVASGKTTAMKNMKPKILILASGTKMSGGSGFQELVEQSRVNPQILEAEIVGVISNRPEGGVFEKAKKLNIPFEYWAGPFTEKGYQNLVKKFQADYIMCSGWLKLVKGLDSARTINIHPGPLPKFGGPGMYGHFVHEMVIKSFQEGKINQSAFTMHFVTEKYDEGPLFFSQSVPIFPDDTAETLAKRVNEAEHKWQPVITEKVLTGEISWDGKDPKTLKGQILN